MMRQGNSVNSVNFCLLQPHFQHGPALIMIVLLLQNVPKFLDLQATARMPSLVFTSHSGINRSTIGMVMGCLMLAHRNGFPQEAGYVVPIYFYMGNILGSDTFPASIPKAPQKLHWLGAFQLEFTRTPGKLLLTRKTKN